MNAVNPKRRYRSSLREAQGQVTRDRVVEAGLELFSTRGYATTTVTELAAEAGVAVDTIYKSFGSKVGVVEAIIDAARSDDAVAGMHAAWIDAEGDPGRQLGTYVRGIGRFWSRNDRLASMLQSGTGDADIAAIWARRQALRRKLIQDHVATWPAAVLRPGYTRDIAVDLIWALTSSETFHALVVESGWSVRRWEREISAALERAVLAAPAATT